jgi:hypothetical protein
VPLTKGTPVPTPEQPPEQGEEGWGWYAGCIVQVYGTGPWSYRVWFSEVGKVGYYGPSTSQWSAGTGVIAYVSTAGNPMGIATMIPSGWCDPNGDPLGALDGGVIGGSSAS